MATPADLTDKRLWLRGKDLAGADGATVTAWADQSGAAKDVASLTGTTVAATATPAGGRAANLNGATIQLSNVWADVSQVASSSDYPGFAPQDAFDGNNSTGWVSGNTPAPHWLRFRRATPTVVTSYTIRGDNSDFTRSPRDFRLEGSNDGGATWTTLDTRTGVAWTSATAQQTFAVSGSGTAYTHFRLYVTGTASGFYTTVSELFFNGQPNATYAGPGEIWLVVRSRTTSGGAWEFGTSGQQNHYTFSGTVYTDFGNGTRRSYSPTLSLASTWRLIRATIDASGNLGEWIDNASQLSVASVPRSWRTAPVLSRSWTGDIAEVLVRNTVSTAAEVADLITYFNTEHGLTVPGGSTPPPTTAAEGAVAAVSAIVGEAALARPAEGAIAAVSTATGEPDPDQPAVQHPAEGAAEAISAVEGEADVAHVHPAEGSIDATTDASGEVQVERCAEGTVAATSAVKGEPTILAPSILAVTALAGSETQIGRVDKARLLPTQIEALAGSDTEITGRIERVTIIGEVIAEAGSHTRVVMPRDWGEDPRTGRPAYRLRIVKRDGSGVVELDEATITPETEAINTPDSFSFKVARANKKARRVLAMAHQAQLWRGKIMLTKGDIGPGRAEGPWITFDVKDPSALLFGGRIIGRVPKRQLLRNADFTKGLAYWTGAYGPDSALKAPPTARVVDEDYAASGKALELGAVDKAVTTKVDVKTSAVFVPNKATYLKGGEDKIKAVGANIPEGATIRLTGFTANDGTGDGLALSLARAQAAKATLAGMGKKFVFNLPENWSKIDPGKRRDDGTVGGRGYYQQIPGGLAANRRVTIAYEGVQKAEGHQQYQLQKLTVMQPTSAKVPLTLTFAGDMRILRWDGAPKDGWAMRLILEDIVATKEVAETGAVFAPNQSTYLPGGEQKIKDIGEKIPEGATINLVGHTADNRRNGDNGDGLDLSLRRAQAAKATLNGMGKKFTFKLPAGWSKIDPAKRKDDGSVGGRGYYDPVAGNGTDAGQAKNRRVEVGYTAKIIVDAGTDSSATMDELTPRVRWAHYETSVDIPADGKTRTLEAWLIPPAGLARWANVGLWPHDQLGYFDVDQALIVKALVEHAQDGAMGKGSLGIGTRTPLTGVPRTKEYPFHERMPVGTALEWFTSIAHGVDIDCEVTPTSATIVTHFPRQGTSADIALVHGGSASIVTAYRPLAAASRDLASSIIMQADGSGASRPEAYARDDKALGGTLLEAVVSAESETSPGELQEGADVALAQSINPRPGWEVVIDPAHTTRVLDEIHKGDLVRLVLPDEGVDRALRMVSRTLDPATDTPTLTLVEA